jgi:hypothetical protein
MDGAPELTVHWNEHLGQYLAVHGVFRGWAIALRTADRPEGPWSEPRLYFGGVPSPPGLNVWDTYVDSALAHPELSRDGGRIEYLTYHRGTGIFWTGETRLLEVVFK